MPKIIIGVGGTGTKIIREISRRWDTTGRRPPGVALAVVDARDMAPENGEIPGAIFLPNKPINFGDEFAAFKDVVSEWWPKTVFPGPWINFSEGCGAMRPYGRFFAFYYSSKLRRTIEEATSSLVLRGPGNVGRHGLAFSIIVVGSLGNGTGGGTMLDVATLARHHISYATRQITCLGIFIPSSVTRAGNVGVPAKRVGASGFASLLELQYEFNRADTSADFRPTTPYKFKGWSGVDYTEFHPGQDDELSTPYDAVLLLDRRDRKGLTVDYPGLINIAAEGISMLAEGGDADSRLVDSFTMIATGGAKRFGSLGATRVTVPGTELLQYATGVHSLSMIDTAISSDEDAWRHLLADETPGDARKRILKREDASIATSVDFFLEHILGIKETEAKTKARRQEADRTFNQLFDRFDADDKRTLKEFADITADLSHLKDADAIYNRAAQINQFIKERTADLGIKRSDALTDNLWKKEPNPNPEKPLDAGVKWLINDRVMEFVNAGAFGLLAAWLHEFNEQIEINIQSVRDYEEKENVNKAHEKIDLTPDLNKLRQMSQSFTAAFRRGALVEGVALVRQHAKNKLQHDLWKTKIEAVLAFYGQVQAHVSRIEQAAKLVCERLNDPKIKSRFEKLRDDSTAKLKPHAVIDPDRVAVTGVKAERFIGGDDEMRQSLMDVLQSLDSTRETTLLEQLSAENVKLFAARLGPDAPEIGMQELQRVLDGIPNDWNVLLNAYRVALDKTVTTAVEPIIADRFSIDKVLEAEARALANRYRDARQERTARVTNKSFSALRQELETYGGIRILQRLENLPWDEDEDEAIDRAIDLLVAGRIFILSQYATPQWQLADDAKKLRHITSHCFVTYPSSAHRVGAAIRYATTSGLNEGIDLKAQADDYANPNRIDLVFVELGADLDALRTEQEKEDYRWAMLEEKSFTPHITEQYRQMGLRYLSREGYQTQPGAAILALAEEYGIIEGDRGIYKLKLPIKAKRDRQKVVYPSFATGQKIGERGLENVVRDLESGKGTALQILGGLRDSIYAAMKHQAQQGGEHGWSVVADHVGGIAARLRVSAQSETDATVADIRARQADALDALAAEIAESAGRTVPSMFAS